MSVYYNLFKQNNEMKLLDPAKFSEVSYMPILKNQGDYLVGVKRFKIPSQGIDAFRLYPDRYYLGMSIPANAGNLSVASACAFDLTTGGKNSNIAGMPFDRQQNQNYIPINSNVRFCEVMNRTIAQSFLGRFNVVNNDTKFTYSVSNNTVSYPPTPDPAPPNSTNQYANFPVKIAYPVSAGATGVEYNFINDPGQVNLGYELHIKSFSNIVQATTKLSHKLSDILIHMIQPITGSTGNPTEHYIPLFENCGNNIALEDFNTIFPQGICVCSYGKIPISQLALIDRNVRFTETVFVCPDGNSDLNLLVGQIANNDISHTQNTNKCSPTVFLRCLNSDTPADKMNGSFDMTYDFNLYYSMDAYFGQRQNSSLASPSTGVAGSITGGGFTVNIDVGQLSPVPSGLPTFTVDSDDKISLSMPQWMFAGKFGAIYLSSGLSSLLNLSVSSLGGLTIQDYDPSNFAPNLINPSPVNISNKLGLSGVANTRDVLKDAEMGSYITLGNINRSESNANKLVITESRASNYKRAFLWGLQIRSNNLSTSGEFVSGGKSFQKVLTDFVIDPSTNQGDYLLFEPESGGQRFYPLNATGELRQLDVSVYMVDMNNNTSVLNLPPNTSLSLKIEFRPKNMVYNYIDNSTMS